MDFHLDEDLVAVQDLARQILTDHARVERVRTVESTAGRIDEDLWRRLADAGLLGLAVPESAGGAGLGLAALCVLLEEQGRTVAPVPLWAHCVAAWLLAEHGSPDRDDAVLAGAADGSVRLTLALEEYDGRSPARPACTAVGTGDGWLLTGTKAGVPAAAGAAHVLVAATAPDGPGVFLVDATAGAWTLSDTTSHDRAGTLVLVDAPARRVGEAGALPAALDAARVALAAVQLGVAEGALHLAATYTATREQFGRPLATFQSLQHQLADCWIDIDAMRVTLWAALTVLEDGIDAARAVGVAAWWCHQAGPDVAHRVQHVHGGIGVDVDYPVHRYFLWARQIATTLGSAAADLADLGDLLAVEEVAS